MDHLSGSGFRAVRGSGFGSGRASFDGLVRLIDLAPTVLDLIGVPPPVEFEGRSIVSSVVSGFSRTGASDERTAYIEAMDANLTRNWAPLTGVATRDYKLIDLPDAELYDLREDPHETVNLFARNAERARTLEALLRGMTTAFQSRGSSGEKTTLSADARQRLQALGYVASSADPGTRVYTAADDPKTLIGVSNDLDRAVKAFNAGSRAEAMAAVRTIVREHPSFSTAQGQLASMQRQSGDLPGAIATLEEMVRRGIADQRVMIVLADYLAASGALPKALAPARRRRRRASRRRRGAQLARGGGDAHGPARSRARRPSGRCSSSIRRRRPPTRTSAPTRCRPATSHGAVGDLTRALELDPRQYTVLYNLALALDSLGRRDEARRDMERFVDEAPPRTVRAARSPSSERCWRDRRAGWAGWAGWRDNKKGGRAEGFPSSHPALPAYPAYPAFCLPNYQIKAEADARRPRSRIAVGCWNVAPAVVVIVSAAYAFARLKPSRNRRTLACAAQVHGLLDAEVDHRDVVLAVRVVAASRR